MQEEIYGRATDIDVHVYIFCNISHDLNQIICCDHSLESSRRDDSNEWSQHSNRLRNKKLSVWKTYNRIEYLWHCYCTVFCSTSKILQSQKFGLHCLHGANSCVFFTETELQVRCIKQTSINSICVFFTKSYVLPLVRIVSMTRF